MWCQSMDYNTALLLCKPEVKDRLVKRKELWELCGQYRGRIPVWKDELNAEYKIGKIK